MLSIIYWRHLSPPILSSVGQLFGGVEGGGPEVAH